MFKPTKSSINEIKIEVQGLSRNFTTATRRGLFEGGKLLRKTTQDLIKNPPKTGRLYRYRSRRIRASAPGQPPANRSGNLRRSTQFKVLSPDRLRFFNDADYAAALENARRIEPRPFMQPSVDANERNIYNAVQNSINAQFKK